MVFAKIIQRCLKGNSLHFVDKSSHTFWGCDFVHFISCMSRNIFLVYGIEFIGTFHLIYKIIEIFHSAPPSFVLSQHHKSLYTNYRRLQKERQYIVLETQRNRGERHKNHSHKTCGSCYMRRNYCRNVSMD